MKKALLLTIVLCQMHLLRGQGPVVPSEMQFANLRLKINESARNEIQDDVDALVQSPRYFNEKVLRAQLYFPLIEKIFDEENVPEDFKYLVVQESALIPDAVSSSNAVGYWQFKDFTGIEMGLRIDSHIDERMNIVSSTHAAARYFKKNNFYFDNWIYALQAYQMGAGAALKVVDEGDRGARSMNITKKTYWYVKKFIAHKVAYEYALQQLPNPERELLVYTRSSDKTLKSIASELMVDEEELSGYNLWLKRGKIPGDKSYSVIVPVNAKDKSPFVAAASVPQNEPVQREEQAVTYEGLEDPDRFPEIEENRGLFSKRQEFVNINGIPGVIGGTDQKPVELAKMAEITESKFLAYNEMFPHQSIREGQVYYFGKKKAKAKVHYHTVNYDETLWDISQKYGVRLSKLLKKNRLKDPDDIKPGMIIWLRYIRPVNEPVRYHEVTVPVIVTNKSKPLPVVVNGSEFSNTDEVKNDDILTTPIPIDSISHEDIDLEEPESDSAAEDLSKSGIKVRHEVKAKETLYSISKMYGVEVMEIVIWNNLNISDGIRIGESLDIWVAEGWKEQAASSEEILQEPEMEDGFIEYRVKPGDTLYAIASRYGVTVEEIQTWNKKSDSNVSIGEKIKIRP